jgi:hypothetical protein
MGFCNRTQTKCSCPINTLRANAHVVDGNLRAKPERLVYALVLAFGLLPPKYALLKTPVSANAFANSVY